MRLGASIALTVGACALAALCPALAGAATYAVNSTADAAAVDDAGDGICDADPGVGTLCTLRAAIQEANGTSGADLVSLPAGDFVLGLAGAAEDASATGDLDLNSDITLRGFPGTTIDADGLDRVLHIGADGGDPAVRIVLTAITGGGAVEAGAGILLDGGDVALDRAEISGNVASSAGVALGGGILFRAPGSHSITASTIAGNDAEGGDFAAGGGLRYEPQTGGVAITNSTISGNLAVSAAGPAEGGGVWAAGRVTLHHATLVLNEAGGVDYAAGGNIYTEAGDVRLRGTILAEGIAGPGSQNCSGETVTLGGNLEAHPSAGLAQCAAGTGDARSRKPGLVPLADRGGPTRTHALLGHSPALNALPTCGLNTDQRGKPRRSGYACEIGAYERQQFSPLTSCFGKRATLFGTAKRDRIVGTEGNDVIIGLAGGDEIDGLGGRDRICGGPGPDRVRGGSGDDLISGSGARDLLDGGAGADRLLGEEGPDELRGGSGADLLIGGDAFDLLIGGAGADRAFGGTGNDRLAGGAGRDALWGQGGHDRIKGHAGADRLRGGFGADLLIGGPGFDILDGGLGIDRCRAKAGETVRLCP